MKASICIQKAVRQHLKKKRVTMSRTRCVQFFWRKFCRLLKLNCSVKASRVIKSIMQNRVNKILKQYRAYKFRISIKERIVLKKVIIVQKILRKVLTRNKQAHYEANMSKILYIQSYFRMLKPRRKFKQIFRNKMMQEMQAKNFEKGFMMLYNQKPTKRKNKINKILQEQQDILKKERIFIGQQGITHNGVTLGKSTSKIISVIGQQQIPKERREKTIRALRYIKKYQHLYQDEILAMGFEIEKPKQRSPDKRFPIGKQKLGQHSTKFLNMDSSRDKLISQRHMTQIEHHQQIIGSIKGLHTTNAVFKQKKNMNLDSQLSKIVDEKLYSQIAQNKVKNTNTLREKTPSRLKKTNDTGSGQMKNRNEIIPFAQTRGFDKPKLSKKSPYLKDQQFSIWEGRQDVQNQYLLQAQATASTVYPKGSQISNKLQRLRALSPLGNKKSRKENHTHHYSGEMTSTQSTNEDKILAHAKAEKLALLQSTRGSIGKKKKQNLFESTPYYEDNNTIGETPSNSNQSQLPYLISNQTFSECPNDFFKKSVFDSHDQQLPFKHQILNSQARVGRRIVNLEQKMQAGFHQRLKPILKPKQRDLSELQEQQKMHKTASETTYGVKPNTSPKVSQGCTSNYLVPIKSEDRQTSYMQIYNPNVSEKKKKSRQKSDISSKQIDPSYHNIMSQQKSHSQYALFEKGMVPTTSYKFNKKGGKMII